MNIFISFLLFTSPQMKEIYHCSGIVKAEHTKIVETEWEWEVGQQQNEIHCEEVSLMSRTSEMILSENLRRVKKKNS